MIQAGRLYDAVEAHELAYENSRDCAKLVDVTGTLPFRAGTDARRLHNVVGIVAARGGLSARHAVLGTLLTLLVSSRASSALAITFALTAHQLVSWLVYLWLGRASDRSRARLGRRTPFIGIGLVVAGAATALLPHASGYWTLVALLVVMRLAFVAYWAPAHAVLPESFGRSRWLKALLVTAGVSFVMSHLVRGVAIVTWKQDDPATWALAFEAAGALTVVAGLAILFLVRQPHELAARGPVPLPGWRHRLQEVWAAPNAPVLVAGLLLDAASFGATGRLVAVFFANELGAGGAEQAAGGLVGMWTGVAAGFAGLWLIRRVSVARLAVVFPLAAAAIALFHLLLTNYWQAVTLEVALAPLALASFVALSPLYVRLLPASLGLGEATGMFLGPKAVVSVGAGYLAAAAVDATDSYRVIWLFPVVLQLAKAALMTKLEFPDGRHRLDLARLTRSIHFGYQRQMARPLLHGPLEANDADTSSVISSLRAGLENTYISDAEADQARRHRPRRVPDAVVRAAVAPESGQARGAWYWDGSHPGDYEIRLSGEADPEGRPSVAVRSTVPEPAGFTSFTNKLTAREWHGRKLRVSANLRGVDVAGAGGLWLRLDGTDVDRPVLAFVNMSERPIVGSVNWSRHCVELEVPDSAVTAAWGVYLDGAGELWVSGLRLDELEMLPR